MTYEFSRDRNYSANYLGTWPSLLAEYVGKPGLRFLEIGSFDGRSAIWLLENVLTGAGSEIFCVDPWEDEEVYQRFLRNVAGLDCIAGLKQTLADAYRWWKDGSFDVIYIDGNHIAPDVLSDSVLSWRLLKVGGMLIWDDYFWTSDDPRESGPGKAIDAFLGVMGDRCEVLEKRMQVAVRKVRA